MLTTNDLENALKKNYVDFSEAIKATLTDKLNENPVIKSKMAEIEQYNSITEKCNEMDCQKHTVDDEDEDEDDSEDDDDEDLDESLTYEKGRNYLIPLRQTAGRRLKLKLVEKETYTGKLVDFDRDGVQLGWTWVEPGNYRIEGTIVPWKNIISMEFVKESGRRIF